MEHDATDPARPTTPPAPAMPPRDAGQVPHPDRTAQPRTSSPWRNRAQAVADLDSAVAELAARIKKEMQTTPHSTTGQNEEWSKALYYIARALDCRRPDLPTKANRHVQRNLSALMAAHTHAHAKPSAKSGTPPPGGADSAE